MRLIASKNEKESLTDVILREVNPNRKQKDIMKLFGSWEGEREEFEKIFGDVLNNRRSVETRDIEASDCLLRLRFSRRILKRLPRSG